MYKQYFKQAWNLMRQNRFYSGVYIIGTGLAISMVMVIAIVYHIRTADIMPEVHRSKYLYIDQVKYERGKGNSNFFWGIRSAKECLMPLKSAKEVAIMTNTAITSLLYGDTYVQIPGGDDPQKVQMMGTNNSFWRLFSFSFIEGKPFSEEEFQSGFPRVVVSESLARRIFSTTTGVTGKSILLDDTEYSVSGVVKDVSAVTPSVYADMWVPYTSMPLVMEATDERDVSVGLLTVCILPADGQGIDEVSRELEALIDRYNTTLVDGKISMMNGVETHLTHVVRQFVMGGSVTAVYLMLLFLILLFLLIPALNLSGLNASRMQDRISELGVRKAFGARKNRLLTQILIENLLLMLPGGLVGLLVSYGMVALFQQLLLAPGIIAMVQGSVQTELTFGMLLSPAVFGYAFLVCFLLNLMSSMIPAWRAIRMNITESLNHN